MGKRGPKAAAHYPGSPCAGCAHDLKPQECGMNGLCSKWRKWFAETWPKAAEKAKLEMKL